MPKSKVWKRQEELEKERQAQEEAQRAEETRARKREAKAPKQEEPKKEKRSQLYGTPKTENPNQPSTVTRVKAGGTAPYTPVDALVESATPRPKPYLEKNPAQTTQPEKIGTETPGATPEKIGTATPGAYSVKPLSYSPYAGTADQIRGYIDGGDGNKPEEKKEEQPKQPEQPQPTSPYTGFMGEEDEDEGGVDEEYVAPDYFPGTEIPMPEKTEAQKQQEQKEQLKQEREALQAQYNDIKYRFMNGKIWGGEGEPPETGIWYTPEEAQQFETMEAQLRDYDEKIAELQADVNAGEALGTNIMAGLESAGYGLTQALDWLGGENSLPWAMATEVGTLFGVDLTGKNPVTKLKEKGAGEVEYWKQRGAEATEGNDTWETVGQHAQSISQSAPFIVLNLMTMGGAGGAAASTEGLEYISSLFNSSGMQGVSAMASQGLKALATNPSAQYSFATTFGNSYDDALKDGATPAEATVYAVLNGTYNAMIEVGGADEALGGMQALPAEVQKAIASGDKNFLLNYAKSIAGEVNEEEWQGFLERGLKSIYQDVALYSNEDPNAIINPQVILDTAKNTAIDTAIMSGTQMAAQYGINALANAGRNQQKAQAPEVEALVQAATPQAPGIKPGMEIGQESDTGTGGGPSVAEILAQQAQGQAPSTPTIKQAPGMELTPETDTGTGGPIVAPAAEEARESVPVPPTAPEANTELSQEFNSGTDEIAPEAPAAQSAKEAAQSIAASIGLPQSKAAETGLQEIADYIQSNGNGEGVDEETVQNMAREAAENIIAEIPGQETGDKATFDAVKDILGKRGLQISDELRGDVADYNDWRKSLFGKLNLVKDGEAIDSIYSELSTLMPGLFPANITAQADMVNRIVEVLDGTKPQTTTWADTATQADYDAAVEEMTQKVLDAAQNVGSTAEAVSEENLASLAGQEPPVMLGNQPTTPSTVEANGPTVERGFAKNVRTTDSTEEALAKSLGKDKVTYERLLNKDVLARSQELFDRGIDRAKSYLYDAIYNAKNGAKLPPEAVPLARMVANQMAADGDVVGAERLIADVAAELTQAGQLGQVGKILRQGIQTPEGRLYGMQKTVEALNRSADGKYEVELPQDLVEKYNEQTTDEGRDAVITEMQQAIADQIPSTFLDKFTALRYTAMLGNFKTQARNVLGNVGSTVMRMTKDRLASVGEIIYSMFNPDFERTKSIWAGGKLYKEALGDFENVAEETMGEGKYSDNRSMGKEIEDKRTILKINGKWGTNEAKTAAGRSIPAKAARKAADLGMGALEGWRKGTNWAMDYGDRVFNAINYADALGGWLAAHNIKSISDASPEMLNRARKYAIQQAQEATFRDKNQFSDWAAGLGKARNPNNKVEKAAEAVSKGALPFRRTPANIAVRAEEYSPIGLANTIVDAWNAAKGNGDVTASDVIDQAAKTLTGTGLAALGLIMAKSGLFGIKARGKDDDEKQENFDKLRGAQDYSWIMPDGTSVTMDWVTPGSIPFFMGVELADLMDEGGLTFADGWSIIESFTDPMLELSMLSGLNDALNVQSAYSGDGTKPLVLVAENALASLLSQAAPTLMGQIERMGEDYRQSTYYDNDSQIPKVIQKAISKVGAKIPGWDYQQQDYIDAWGRKQENKKGWDAFYENFISPYYTSEDRSTPIDDELQRLYDSGMDKVFPEYAKRNPGGDLGRLSPEEYETYATVKGQTSLALVQDFIESDQYKDLSDNERAEIIGNLYKLANTSAKTAVMRQRDEDYTGVEKGDYATALTDAGMETSDVLDFLFGVAEDGSPTQAELKSYYKEHPDEADYIGALWDASGFTGKDTATWELYLASVKGK